MAMGIDVHGHVALTWAMVGVISVFTGVLWTFTVGRRTRRGDHRAQGVPDPGRRRPRQRARHHGRRRLIGLLESLSAGYLDPVLGAGFSSIAPYLLLLVVLFVRPYGMFGRPRIERV